jgi:hypothetical protein
VKDGVEAAGVVTGRKVGPEGLVVICGCLSSVEHGVEAAGVSVSGWDCEVITCSCMSSEEAGEDTQRLSETGWSAPKGRLLPAAVYPL